MQAAIKMGLGLAVLFALMVVAIRAEEKAGQEQTLKGTITCAKCDLKLTSKCATVIKVTKGGKDTVYYFDTASNKKYHKNICTTPMEGEVTGTVSTEGGKHIVHVDKVHFD
jgi:hypothetical protein